MQNRNSRFSSGLIPSVGQLNYSKKRARVNTMEYPRFFADVAINTLFSHILFRIKIIATKKSVKITKVEG